MREREKERLKSFQLTERPLDVALQRLKNGKCPYCLSEKLHHNVSTHIGQMHGESAYETRARFGLNRHTPLCLPEMSEHLTEVHPPTSKAFLAYDRSQIAKFRESGLRPEGQENVAKADRTACTAALIASWQGRDRKAVARSIPPETRHRSGVLGRQGLEARYGKERIREWMLEARARRTEDDIRRGQQHATETMNRKYRSSPEWVDWWKERIREGRREYDLDKEMH